MPTAASKQVSTPRIGDTGYMNLSDVVRVLLSAGRVEGGVITDAGGGSVDISAGKGFLRATDSDQGTLEAIVWSAASGQAIPTDTARYVGVEYNAGTPQIVIKSTDSWDQHTAFRLGSVVNESGAIHIKLTSQKMGDALAYAFERLYETRPLERAERLGGLILDETGTRNVTVSASELYDGLSEYDIAALDTSGSDTFDRYYRDGGSGFTKQSGQTQWNNTQYDDGDGTLGTISNNRFAVQWFYIESDGSLVSLFGQGEYVSLAGALDEAPPASVPLRLQVHGRLIARIAFQESGSTASEISSAFDTSFNPAEVSNHNNLGGLDTGDFQHLTAANKTDLTDAGASTLHYHLADRVIAVRKNSTGGDIGVRRRINLIEGTNITLTVADDAGGDEVDITIAASGGGAGEANTASNAGSGVSLPYQKTGVDLEFNGIKSENNRLGVALDGASHDVELTVNESNINHNALDNLDVGDFQHLTAAELADLVTSDNVLADNGIVRGHGGARGVQGSEVSIDDSNNVTGLVNLVHNDGGYHEFKDISAPGAPVATKGRLYKKSGTGLYYHPNGGSEKDLTAGVDTIGTPLGGQAAFFSDADTIHGKTAAETRDQLALETVNPTTNGFRLTPTTATPVITGNVISAGTIYASPYKSNRIALYTGGGWKAMDSAEVSYALSGRTTDLPFDVFAWDSSGTLTLEVTNWTSATARATAIVRQDGVWCKSGSLTRRYLGTCRPRSATAYNMRLSADAQDNPVEIDLWNVDNRVALRYGLYDNGSSYVYNTATTRQWRADTDAQIEIVVGIQEDAIVGRCSANNYATTAGDTTVGVGYDSTSTYLGPEYQNSILKYDAFSADGLDANFAHQPTIGRHYYAWLQRGPGIATCTWYPYVSNSYNSGVHGKWNC